MADIDLHKAYNSLGDSIHDLFDRTEEGFFVPMYQREYTWEEDNINQLFDDLVLGIRELSDKDGDNATTFLGTTILTNLVDKKCTVQKGEDKAQPTAVQLVIDGQQRIATIALLSIGLIERLNTLSASLPKKAPYTVLQNHCADLVKTLPKLYSIKLGRGSNPSNKPKIIRAKEDRWTYDGDDVAYGSPVARYIATYIRTNNRKKAFDAVDANFGARVRGNVDLINQWLDAICDAHVASTPLHDQFPVGEKIVTNRMQEYVFGFKDDALKAVIGKTETTKDQNDYFAAALHHVFLLAYYLLRRCGVNRLQPTREEWGFDMFQALNATGTPLTAMETFLPQVMQAEQAAGTPWEKSPSREYMEDIDKLFEATTSNEQKSRRTNDLLGTFALCHGGEKLGNKFSAQRRWMTRVYEKNLPTIEDKHDFLCSIARVATFFYAPWHMEDVEKPHHIRGLEDHPQGEFTSLLTQYLKGANSKLSAPILARFYSQMLEDKAMADEFVDAAKACAAFFTLWRSANSTSGLDEIYRRFFKGSKAPVKVGEHSWSARPNAISSNSLKKYFWGILKHKGIDKKGAWITASERFLLYTEVKTICRFVLFIAGNDQVADDGNPGLSTPGKEGVCPILKLGRWDAKDHKSLEHVAPQTPPENHNWDARIYTESKVHDIGNLILLPTDINRFVDNKDWAIKFLHYSHVGVRKKKDIEELSATAQNKGMVLSKKAIEVLSATRYNCAVEPILKLGEKGPWDADLIDRRTRQIKELAWKTLSSWLKT